jgi:arylsulfatase A-like enzyme
MVYSFDNAKAKETHTTQYFEMFGNRGIYHNGWIACTRHSIPWLIVENPPLSKDVWELKPHFYRRPFTASRLMRG